MNATATTQTTETDGRRWTLTQEAFDAFLARLDTNRDRAGQAYEELRTSVVRYLGNGTHDAERWADEVIDRAIRRNQEQQIDNIRAFLYGVAKRIRIEMRRGTKREIGISELVTAPAAPGPSPEEQAASAAQQAWLQECCEKLSSDEREFLMTWYTHTGRERIVHRRRLAAQLGVAPVTLRVRALRTRRVLQSMATAHGMRPASVH